MTEKESDEQFEKIVIHAAIAGGVALVLAAVGMLLHPVIGYVGGGILSSMFLKDKIDMYYMAEKAGKSMLDQDIEDSGFKAMAEEMFEGDVDEE